MPFFCASCFAGRFIPHGWGGRFRAAFFPAAFALFLALAAASPLRGDIPPPLPHIPRLDSRDIVFKQYLEDVEDSRRSLFSSGAGTRANARTPEERAASLTIYSYTPKEGEDLFAIAARCSIPYDALASLNHLSHREDLAGERPLLLPSMPGIFVSEEPASDLERLLFSARAEAEDGLPHSVLISVPLGGADERFYFIPGDEFSPTERIYFLNHGFHFPLRSFRLTSSYGPRVNPVTGRSGTHGGVDLAAPEGSEVRAVRAGTVTELGEDPVLGNYVIVSHDNNWLSFYGHLSAVKTAPGASVRPGDLVGLVGSTGQSTGPHLHFELRQNGRTKDPARLLGLFKNN